MQKFFRLLLLILSLPLGFGLCQAEAAVQSNLPTPQDYNQVDFYLLTVGRGPQPEALFCHTILRVVDRMSATDLSFNWGIFDFSDPLFAWKFYRGDLNYALAISDTDSLVDYYRRVERRSIIQDRIVLTLMQKQKLYERLINNALPENLRYQYSQFLDNCATRPRDHLNAVVGDVLRLFFVNRPAIVTRRQYVSGAARPNWWVALGLDMSSNDFLDAKMSNWDEMFMPSRLRELLTTVPALDDSGKPSTDHKLIEGAEVIVDMPEPPAAVDPYFVFNIIVGGVLVGLAFAVGRHPPDSTSALLLGIMSLVFGLWSSLWGTLLVSNWLLSTYVMVNHNAVLWLTWPIDWVFVGYGLLVLATRRRPHRLRWLARAVLFTGSLHLTALLAATVLCLTGILHQEIQPVLASTGICALIYYGTIVRHAAAREP